MRSCACVFIYREFLNLIVRNSIESSILVSVKHSAWASVCERQIFGSKRLGTLCKGFALVKRQSRKKGQLKELGDGVRKGGEEGKRNGPVKSGTHRGRTCLWVWPNWCVCFCQSHLGGHLSSSTLRTRLSTLHLLLSIRLVLSFFFNLPHSLIHYLIFDLHSAIISCYD